ncbi:MAG: S24/S26 family peptidase [Chitinispirillaceae bacterium]|nr:S24/S26 family peptidase [Chitinispirillaceae bacterium]
MKRWIDRPAVFNTLLESEGSINLRIHGNSMWPLLQPGECVSIRKHRTLRRGECYLFRYADSILLHRLAEKKLNTCLFCGDNSSSIEAVPNNQVMGRIDDHSSPLFNFFVTCLNRLFIFFNRCNPTTVCLGNSIRRALIRHFLKVCFLFYGRKK